MIKIPHKKLTPQGDADLAILCEALFMDIKDERMVTVLWDKTVKTRVDMVRESILCETLFEMAQIFGEAHFGDAVIPAIQKLEKIHCTDENYLKNFEDCIKEII
ncbi:MAG: hypothetical protein GY928_16890 [Colwellia sp.]|nr:hypothetical protein [Colwellia sp.]